MEKPVIVLEIHGRHMAVAYAPHTAALLLAVAQMYL
jgi:hypothetical protein